MKPYHTGRALAIVCGVAATGGAIALLLADAIGTGHWSQDHALVPLVVGLTVATGHLASTALRRGRLLAAAGFAIAFAVGTTVTVLNGVGRQSASVGASMAETQAHNQAIADKGAELVRARQRFEQANAQAEKEMTGSRCAQRCNDWKLRATEVAARVKELETEIARLGAPRPVNAKAEKVGEIATAIGLDGKRAASLVLLLEPLLVPFLLEWTAIIAMGYGFTPNAQTMPAAPASAPARATAAQRPVSLKPKRVRDRKSRRGASQGREGRRLRRRLPRAARPRPFNQGYSGSVQRHAIVDSPALSQAAWQRRWQRC